MTEDITPNLYLRVKDFCRSTFPVKLTVLLQGVKGVDEIVETVSE